MIASRTCEPLRSDRAGSSRLARLAACIVATTTFFVVGCATEPKPAPAAGPPLVSAESVDNKLGAAEAAKQSGDYGAALELFREVLAVNPTVASAYVGIGSVYVAQGNYVDAEPAYARAARIEPRNFQAQFGHGTVLQKLKRFVEAIRAFARALSIKPDDFDANLQMAQTYLAIDDPAGALVYAEKAAQLQPGSGPARVTLGQVYERLGRSREAIEQFETAMELVEPSPELLLSLVKAYGDEKRFDEAVNAAEVLVKTSPSAAAYERLGWAYFRLGKYPESMKAYVDAVRIDEAYWQALNGIGVNALNTWLLSNRTDARAAAEAKDAFRRSLRVNPQQPKVVRLLTTYPL